MGNIKQSLLAGLFSLITIGILTLLTYKTDFGIFLIASFGSSMVLLFGYPESPFAQPKNVFFGHILSALSGVLMFYFLGGSPVSISLGIALAIFVMMLTKTIHPPAGANPIIAILGAKTFEFVIMPVGVGALFIVIFAYVYNKIWKRT